LSPLVRRRMSGQMEARDTCGTGDQQKRLFELYRSRREEIRRRLEEFKTIHGDSEERIFAELCFCICTPQSSALICWKRIKELSDRRILYEGSEREIASGLGGVRFKENKARFIVEARRRFSMDGNLGVRSKLEQMAGERSKGSISPYSYRTENKRDVAAREAGDLREAIAGGIKGLGMKEASHFLRNIGLGGELAILDRHILRNLAEYGIIDEVPKVLSRKTYLGIEEKMRCFSRSIGIPMDELDLLLWAKETGIVFK
jgi:N-glycosylase/DNA lyase